MSIPTQYKSLRIKTSTPSITSGHLPFAVTHRISNADNIEVVVSETIGDHQTVRVFSNRDTSITLITKSPVLAGCQTYAWLIISEPGNPIHHQEFNYEAGCIDTSFALSALIDEKMRMDGLTDLVLFKL